jgi:hypothetical protein
VLFAAFNSPLHAQRFPTVIRDANGRLPIDIAKQKQNETVSGLLNTQTHQN